jgi:hypothetical protein
MGKRLDHLEILILRERLCVLVCANNHVNTRKAHLKVLVRDAASFSSFSFFSF